jgi:hypothetical protein
MTPLYASGTFLGNELNVDLIFVGFDRIYSN